MRILLLVIPFLLQIQAEFIPSDNCQAPIYLTQSDVTPWVGITVDTAQKADFVNGLNLFKCTPDTLFVYLVNGVLTRANWWLACSNTATNGWRVRDTGSRNTAYSMIPVGCVKPTCTNQALYDGTESIFSENPSLQLVPAQQAMATNGPFQLICPAGSILGFAASPTSMIFDATIKITCESGGWTAKTTANPTGQVISQGTKYGCFSGMTSGTIPVKASAAVPATTCKCAFEDLGAALNLAPPTSLCVNRINQVLSCEQKIYVTNGSELVEFDRVSCSAGKWHATGCDGSIIDLNTASVQVQCGKTSEPPLCAKIPSRGGLFYVGQVDGLQRYACPAKQAIKIYADGSYPAPVHHGKYIDCNATYARVGASDNLYNMELAGTILNVSCHDYYNTVDCNIPYAVGTFRRGDSLECMKGSTPWYLYYFDETNTMKEVWPWTYELGAYSQHKSAKCGVDGWSIEGTDIKGVRLAYFSCMPTPLFNQKYENFCHKIKVPEGNVQSNYSSRIYNCYSELEQLKVVTSTGTVHLGSQIQCTDGIWTVTLKDSSKITVSKDTSVSCIPNDNANNKFLPKDNFPLMYAGKTSTGKLRWYCPDSLIAFDMQLNGAINNRMPTRTPYLELASTFYHYVSDAAAYYGLSDYAILNLACVDAGPKHPACTEPWTFGAVRSGNNVKCMRGKFTKGVKYVNEFDEEVIVSAENYDVKEIQCHSDGWQIGGTAFSGKRVSALYCDDAQLHSKAKTKCPDNIKYDFPNLNFDPFRKQYTCYDGESLGYTLNSVTTRAAGNRLFCGTSSTGALEWQWSAMDGSSVAKIPVGAMISCFAP